MNYKLIIFDIDGTLADRDSHILLTNVYEWFEVHGYEFLIALATNQGGVGLRYWMEKDGFGNPSRFPTEAMAHSHIEIVLNQLPEISQDLLNLNIQICFAYQSKKSGQWNPIPPGREDDLRWNQDFRKPAPGMLNLALAKALVYPQETLMVGDADEDEQAAKAAGCHFQKASEFFNRTE